MTDLKKLKVQYLQALQAGNTAQAALLLQQINTVPDIGDPLPSFPKDQACKLIFWVHDAEQDRWHSTGESLTRAELDARITKDWKAAFDHKTAIATFHNLIQCSPVMP